MFHARTGSMNKWDNSQTYATWSPTDKSANVTLSNGNLTATRAGQGSARATIGISGNKKPYFELLLNSSTGIYDIWFGLANSSESLTATPGDPGLNGWALALDGGDYHHGGSLGIASGTWPATTGQRIGIAVDIAAQTAIFLRDNVAMTPNPLFGDLTGTLFPIIFFQSQTVVVTANFGPNTFYTPPAGYVAGLY